MGRIVIVAYRPKPDGSGISSGSVRSIFEDPAGDLWIATHGGGLNRVGHRQPPEALSPAEALADQAGQVAALVGDHHTVRANPGRAAPNSITRKAGDRRRQS